MNGQFDGQVAIVTGGASGIGKAVGTRLAELGCRTVLTDNDEFTLEKTVAELSAKDLPVDGVTLDVRDATAVQRVVDDVKKSHGRLDYMFNNAGVNVFAELIDTSLEDWNWLIDVNLKGVIHGVHAALPIMREQGFGHIINTASLAGISPTPVEGAYSATKHAVVALSLAARIENEDQGVKVSVVCPGVIETPMIDNSKYIKFDGADVFTRMQKRIKVMPVEEAARVIIKGVQKNLPFIIVTGFAHAVWRTYRLAPSSALKLGKLMLADVRKSRIS